jgi:hypothetical protein
MLSSLPFGLVEHVLSFSDEEMKSAVMCSSRDLKYAVSATMFKSHAIVFKRYSLDSDTFELAYGPTVQQWLNHYPTTLTSLSLRDCPFLTDKGCKLLAARFPLLTHLDVSGCLHVSSIAAKKFALGCKSLSNFRSDVSSANSRCADMKVNPAYIKALAPCTSLTTLSLTLGSKNKSDALAPLNLHPALQELNLYLEGVYHVSLDITLPSLKTLRLYRGGWSSQSWADFFQTLCYRGGGGPRLPSLECLQLDSAQCQLTLGFVPDCALQLLLSPPVLLSLTTSKLSSVVVNPSIVSEGTGRAVVNPAAAVQQAQYLSQWTTLGPRNSLGHMISLSIGEPWFKK